MTSQNFTLTFTADKSAAEVFDAINDVRSWWSGEITGNTDAKGAEFSYRYEDLHESTQRITELERGRKIAWHVLDAALSFVGNPSEWKGTTIVFDLEQKGSKTEVRFSHVGLSSKFECYEACSKGWTALLTKNLPRRIASGERQPDAFA
jgi:Activator of Hsp90 ATPase homolog 1-like protein